MRLFARQKNESSSSSSSSSASSAAAVEVTRYDEREWKEEELKEGMRE